MLQVCGEPGEFALCRVEMAAQQRHDHLEHVEIGAVIERTERLDQQLRGTLDLCNRHGPTRTSGPGHER